MSSQREEKPLKPQKVELPPGHGELPEKPTTVKGKGSDDHRPVTGSLPQGPFRPITDPGNETSVEERQ